MCKFKSGIILKGKVVLTPDGNESHSDLLEKLKIADTFANASKKFVRAELTPANGNKTLPIEEWAFRVDQDVVPEWFEKDAEKYEQEFRNAVKDYLKDRLTIIAGRAWNKIKEDGNKTYYILDGVLMSSVFGKTNNYAQSDVREKLNSSDLARQLREEFGNRLVPISTDLLSLDGLDDYGTVEGDILAIPTIDLYRECRKKMSKIDTSWWLATPNSTPSGYGDGCVRCVFSGGDVGYGGFNWCYGVRPFFILES